MGERGRGLTENARRGGSLHRPTARVALGVRPRTRSWCAPYPPARGLGARERRARRRTGPTLVVSAPPAGAGGARVEWHARSDRHEEKRKRRRPTQRANAPARLRRREPPVVYARAARVARASSVAPCAAPSLRSKRRPQKRRETRTTTGDREQEKIITVARTPLLDCGGESHPWCTRAPRASRARRLSLRAPLPRFARSGDHRKDARQGRRPATENRRRSSQLRT